MLLKSYGIDYITEGPNVAAGNVYIRCPWCGDDPSYHLGIHLEKGYYGCWRNPNHRGKDISHLFTKLLGLAVGQKVAEDIFKHPPPDALEAAMASLVGTTTGAPSHPLGYDAPNMKWERWALPIRNGRPTRKFYQYIESRGFDRVKEFIDYYDLRAAIGGRFNSRILIPIYGIRRRLNGWTARAVGPARLRYISYPKGPITKESLLLHNMILANKENAHTLVITEGPFDALKIDWYGRELGVRATCLFGSNPTTTQISRIIELMTGKPINWDGQEGIAKYNRLLVMLDRDAWGSALSLQQGLSSVGADVSLLEQHKDPGGMTKQQVHACLAKAGRF